MIYKAVFFDLDGVLTTNHSGGGQTCEYLSRTFGIDPEIIREVYKPFGTQLGSGQIHYEPVIKALNEATGKNITLEDMRDAFLSTPKNDAMFTLVDALRDKGLIVGVITDNDKERFAALKTHLDPDGLFNPLILSAEVGAFKHSAEIFQEALREAKVKPQEAFFIDNKQSNLEAAQALGMKTIWFDDEKNDVESLKAELKELIN